MFFGWLKRRLINRKRSIFRYWDGFRDRIIDPMVPYRRLLSHKDFDWERTPVLIEVDDEKMAADALGLTAIAVREAFEVEPHGDKGGLTEWECLELLQVFVMSMMSLKKSTNPGPISPEPTEPESSEPSTTNARSDFGSTSSAQQPAEVSE